MAEVVPVEEQHVVGKAVKMPSRQLMTALYTDHELVVRPARPTYRTAEGEPLCRRHAPPTQFDHQALEGAPPRCVVAARPGWDPHVVPTTLGAKFILASFEHQRVAGPVLARAHRNLHSLARDQSLHAVYDRARRPERKG